MGAARIIIGVIGAVICFGAGMAVERWHVHQDGPATAAYVNRKTASLDQQADKFPKGGALLIGDSITERAWAPTVCGRPAFNAGVSGARVQDVAALAKDIAVRTQPSLIVVALGTNDAGWGKTQIAEFSSRYRALLASLPQRPTVLVGLPPIEAGKALSDHVSLAAIRTDNQAIAKIAADRRNGFAAPLTAMPTVDGIHPTPAGARMWVANIEAHCPA